MMRRIAALFSLVSLTCHAGVGLEGEAFTPAPQVEVVWAAANELPKTVTVYRTIPASFSAETISNLVRLTKFAPNEKTTVAPSYPVDDKNLIHYENKEKTRFLNISRKLGYIEFYDGRARIRTHQETNSVPGFDNVQNVAIKLLEQLNIKQAELATKSDSTNLSAAFEHDKRTWSGAGGTPHSHIDSRGVYFTRRLNGIDFAKPARGGARVVLAADGKLAQLQISWRGVVPYKQHAVAAPEDIVKWLKQGKAVLPMIPMNLNLKDLKKVTVSRCSARYYGEPPDIEQDFVYPFAVLEMTADVGGSQQVKLEAYCPVFDDSK